MPFEGIEPVARYKEIRCLANGNLESLSIGVVLVKHERRDISSFRLPRVAFFVIFSLKVL